ncbi:MAG TPA: hydroxylamine oxidation protein HaoB [Nitrospiraceae bacterium]|nr:hydroxylamine oxidation protein HaoB [Nitrospiraceae bacterium]
MEATLTRPSSKILPSLGVILAAGGFLLLGWFAFLWFDPGPAPYQYRLVEEGGIEKFPKLELGAWPDLKLTKQEIHVEGMEEAIAAAYIARRGNSKPVMIGWENHVGEPMIFLDSKLSELSILAPAISKHMPKDAAILAWWDTSRQIQLLTGLDPVFTTQLNEPLIMPMVWKPRMESILKYERDFWAAPPTEEEQRKFQRFADALASEPKEGVEILRELVGGREGYVVVHIADIYKLGLMRPDRIGVAYKDFPVKGSGDVHGLNAFVKRWEEDNKFTAHTVHGFSQNIMRAYFLTDDKSTKTLLAQMLPMTTSLILDFEPLQMVYKEGGYLVYKIPSAQPSNN